jgi:hypothetical protein
LLKFTTGDLEPESRNARFLEATDADERMPVTPSSPSSDQVRSPQKGVKNISTPTLALYSPPTSTTFAYARGIVLMNRQNAYSPDTEVNRTIISSIIIFNLSVVYHLRGLGLLQGRSLLNKAIALYEQSHNLLCDAGVQCNATGNCVIDVLSMALYNNLAHVSFELDRYDESRYFFDYLIRFALSVVPSRYGDASVGVFLNEQKSKFLLNAIILKQPKLAPAA